MKKIFLLLFACIITTTAGICQLKSNKRGIAYGHLSEADLTSISNGISWWYNWYVQPEKGADTTFTKYQLDFVPMAWNASFNAQAMKAFYTAHPEAKYLLGFNEPNFTTQSNMGPKKVAAEWPKLEAIAKEFNLKIVGPAVNYCDKCITEDGVTYSDPVAYLDAFFAACPTCQVDYIGLHNYMCYSGALSSYIDKFKKYKKPIWLTEFACWDQASISLEMQKSLMMGAIDMLENDSMIFRYSWFNGDRTGAYPYIDLFKKEPGKLTELGELYLNYNPIHDTSIFNTMPARIEAESYASMNGISLEATTDFDGMANVGWIDANDWLDYNINISKTSDYFVYIRAAVNATTTLELREKDNVLAVYDLSSTGGWQNWKTFTQTVHFDSGKHTIRVFAPTGGFNLNWIHISENSNTAPTVNAGEDQQISLPFNNTILIASASDGENNSLKYSWKKVSGPSGYSAIGATSDSLKLTGLTAGNYIFKVMVSDGIEVVSDQVNLNVLKATGISTLEDDAIKIFPNPVKDKLIIQTGQSLSDVSLTITDIAGRLVFKKLLNQTGTNIEIDFSKVAPGIYKANVESSQGIISKSIVK